MCIVLHGSVLQKKSAAAAGAPRWPFCFVFRCASLLRSLIGVGGLIKPATGPFWTGSTPDGDNISRRLVRRRGR